MTLETALYLTQSLMALAYIQQSAEHLASHPQNRLLFCTRIFLCVGLLAGAPIIWCLSGLAVISLIMLHRFQGPYNGGSDKMSLLVLWCLTGAEVSRGTLISEAFVGYLALQVVLSYFISGKVKLTNPAWRTGTALRDVFVFSAYPVSKNLRRLSTRTGLLRAASLTVIGFEVAFPIALIHVNLLAAALVMGACFHLANACLFGLNRFFWIWLVPYPCVLWLQDRLFGG